MNKMPRNNDDEFMGIVQDTSAALNYHIGDVMQLCVELLHNVNANDEAEMVRVVLTPVFEKNDKGYCKEIINKVGKTKKIHKNNGPYPDDSYGM